MKNYTIFTALLILVLTMVPVRADNILTLDNAQFLLIKETMWSEIRTLHNQQIDLNKLIVNLRSDKAYCPPQEQLLAVSQELEHQRAISEKLEELMREFMDDFDQAEQEAEVEQVPTPVMTTTTSSTVPTPDIEPTTEDDVLINIISVNSPPEGIPDVPPITALPTVVPTVIIDGRPALMRFDNEF